MNAELIIERAAVAGVALRADHGRLRYSGPREAVDELLPSLREHKAELVELLGSLDLVRRWLVFIGETNQAIVRETLDRCRTDPSARRFFVGMAIKQLPRDD